MATAAGTAAAQDTVKIGLVMPMTGTVGAAGQEVMAAIKLYMAQHGDMVAGRKIELLVRDDGSVPDVAKRLAQELVVNDHVAILGAGTTPSAMSMAPIATEVKIPTVVMISGTSVVTERSPYYVRTCFTLGEQLRHHRRLGDQERQPQSGFRAVRLGAGRRSRQGVRATFQPRRRPSPRDVESAAGQCRLRAVPAAGARFGARHAVRVRAGRPGGTFARQFAERGLDKSGIKLVGPGDIVDDNDLAAPRATPCSVSSQPASISAAHPSALNKAYVAAYAKATGGKRANFISVGGYDGMHLIYEALKKTKGGTDPDALLAAMKGMSWESPRGPISIDPDTRDIIQNVYIRKVEKKDGEPWAIEFATFEAVKDPLHQAAK